MYVDISNEINDRVQNGEYRHNERIPAEIDLEEEFQTTKITVRRALQRSIKMGFLRVIPQSGYFVNPPTIIRLIQDQNSEYNNKLKYEILSMQLIDNNTWDIERAVYNEDEKFVGIEKLKRYSNEYNMFSNKFDKNKLTEDKSFEVLAKDKQSYHVKNVTISKVPEQYKEFFADKETIFKIQEKIYLYHGKVLEEKQIYSNEDNIEFMTYSNVIID